MLPLDPGYFNKVRLLYSFDVKSPEGLFEDSCPCGQIYFRGSFMQLVQSKVSMSITCKQ